MDLCLHPDFTTYMYDHKEGTSLNPVYRQQEYSHSLGVGVGFNPYHLLRVLLPSGLTEEAYHLKQGRLLAMPRLLQDKSLISSPLQLRFTVPQDAYMYRVSTRRTGTFAGIKWEEREADIVIPENLLNY